MSARRNRPMSPHAARVLQALADGKTYGFDVMEATGLPSGTVYPILSRAERRGLVTSAWESPEAYRTEGRPARKYYRLTGEGRAALAEAVARLGARATPAEQRA